ncbi:hypothetical protein BASA61_009515 [Batrachochytrium salamandrivorans]|nr:hypothetical protein BASA61_009515 [Batrachochytrium salamandrivorans]
MTWKESEPYIRIQRNDEYTPFFEEEYKYFKSEYYSVRKLGQCLFGAVHLAIKRSSGLKVVYKIIEKEDVKFYALESSPPPECHSTKVSTLYGKHAGARCMSPRPQSLLLPFEIKLQEYLSHLGYENSYVPRVIDYILTEGAYVLVMEYSGEEWVTLDEYMTEHGKFSLNEIRLIIKEVVTALVFFKKLGILHGDIADRNILYNDKTGNVKLIDFGFSKPLEGCNQDNSVQAKSLDSASGSSGGTPDSGPTEIRDMKNVGDLLYRLLTLEDPFQDRTPPQEEVVEGFRNRLGNPESQLTINAMDLVFILYNYGSTQMVSIEAILEHPFLTSQ